MKIHIDRKTISWGLTAFLVIAASVVFTYFVFHGARISSGFQTALRISMPIIDGVILAYLLTPLVNGIEQKLLIPLLKKKYTIITDKHKKIVRPIAIIFTLIISFFTVFTFFAMVIPQIFNSVQSIILQFPSYLNNFEKLITKILSNNPEIYTTATEFWDKYSQNINDWVNNNAIPNINAIIKSLSLSVISFFTSVWNLVIGLIISIYILGSKETFCAQAKKMAYAFFERRTANSIINDFRFTHHTFSGFISGKILDSLIIGIICFACLSMMKMPYTVLISVIIGVTNIIPFFGPFLGAVPSGLLILMIDPIKCIYFVIFIFILQQFDGNILGPKILGESTGLSSFWVIFSITIFGGLFGIFGMVIGVPFFAVLYAFVRKLTNKYLKKKGLPINTNKYCRLDMISSGNTFIDMREREKGAKKEKVAFRLNDENQEAEEKEE